LLEKHNKKPSSKGTGFVQPLLAHEHWHVDVSYLNIAGTFYHQTVFRIVYVNNETLRT